MAFTGKLVFLAITALAWFVYSVLVNNSGEATPLIIELARDAALVLSGVIVVWALEIIVVDLLVGGVWGVPSTALRRFVVYLVLGLTAAGVILKYALNVNLATLLTTSALITVVIGLAAQSTLAALFSGIALASSGAFRRETLFASTIIWPGSSRSAGALSRRAGRTGHKS